MGCGASGEKVAPKDFPKFKGAVYFRDVENKKAKDDYLAHAYQYATTSEAPGAMTPYAIVYVADDDDIKLAIKYAKEKDISIAVRSGGHQYKGYSSTNGANIQIDLSGIEAPKGTTYPYTGFTFDKATLTAHVGAGCILTDVCKKSVDAGVFFPHGECSHVRVGGHLHTGGYGLITRPYGLFADHILSFDIILADCTKRTVRRDSTDESDKELFFAVIGGSPGNFGVVTHATVRCYRDADHPNARGLKLAYPYNKERLQKVLEILCEQADNGDAVAPDFCYSVMVLGAQHFFSVFGNYDQEMRLHHSDLYGKNGEIYPLATIAITGFWGNLQGPGQEYDASVFARIKEAAGTPLLGGKMMGQFDDEKPIPVSKMMDDWTWKDVREFDLPFVKRLWMSNSTTLQADGFAKWAAERCELIEGSLTNGCKVAAQFMPLSGNTAFKNGNKDNKTSAAWRDSTAFSALDVFYDVDYGVNVPTWANVWATENDTQGVGADGCFSKADRRLIWAPFGDDNLDLTHKAYYDNEETYQRILKTKRLVDPTDVFTPNLFCVGASRKYKAK